jgi:signal transduction histidine kinase
VTNMGCDQVMHVKRTELQSTTSLPEISDPTPHSSGILHAGNLKMDLDRHLLWKANEEIHLSPKEFDLLSYLFRNQGTLIAHAKLLRGVWGPEYGNELEYLRTYIRILRKKIEDDPARPRYILTEPWTGYRFRNPSNRRAQNVREDMASLNWVSSWMVHDLRNPVATIYAGTEMLMKANAAPTDIKRLAANVYRAAGRMRDLLADISCATFGPVSTAQICEIREVIVAASDAASASMDNRRVQVLLDVPRGIKLRLARTRVERVFFNVITNAIEAMPGGGDIRIRARKHRNDVLVEIEDTGSGIPHEIRDRVFEPFVTAGKANGLGLGLALCRKAVLEHGGDMWVEDAAGARFVSSCASRSKNQVYEWRCRHRRCRSSPLNYGIRQCLGMFRKQAQMRNQGLITRRFIMTMTDSQGPTLESELAPQEEHIFSRAEPIERLSKMAIQILNN